MDIFSPDFLMKIAVTILCGSVIGLERQIKGKPSGIRTSIFICLGTCVFVSLGLSVTGQNVDPTRVLGQVVTGIGFLGAGVIISREGLVIGMTSASVIWVLAGVGALTGFNYLKEAIFIAFISLFILIGIGLLENRFVLLQGGVHRNNYAAAKQEENEGPNDSDT